MSEKLSDSGVVELTGKIMVVSIIVLFLVVVFVFLLHLYAKWFWSRREQDGNAPNRRRRWDFAAGHHQHQELTAATILRRGLDPSVLKTIPVVQFDPKDFKDGLECAVCLSELSEGEKTRILPKCNHGFHVECIDMWFHSHSTCPICRNSISNKSCTSTEVSLDSPTQEESSPNSNSNGDSSPNFPTNVLFWGDETQVSTLGGSNLEEGNNYQGPPPPPSKPTSSSSSSSSSQTVSNRPEGMLIIDIPRQIEEEDQKSPISSRMRSLKRLLSRDRRINPFSPTSSDVEHGVRGQT